MAAPTSRADRVYHQDYIARIRYTNTLPPPPNPPKLLNIRNTGLESGQYTSAAFASRLAREQPLNIEADAELGMPINLVGLPGIFNGDESSIQGLLPAPVPHPHDRPLLRSLAALGKTTMSSSVSFLRRSDYLSQTAEQGRSRYEPTPLKDLSRPKSDLNKKRKRLETGKDDDPARMLRDITKGFNLAYPGDAHQSNGASEHRASDFTNEEKAAWNNPRHPTKASLKVLDSYPVLPDLEAFPDPGSYIVMKFNTNPVTESDEYDTRLDVGLLRPLELSPEASAEMEAQAAAFEADSSLAPPGPPQYNYEFFLPQTKKSVRSIRTMLDVNDSDNQDSSLYDAESGDADKKFFRYERVRAYETYQQSASSEDPYGDAIALSLHDAESNGSSKRQTAAYVYPVIQRTFIRPRRATHASQLGSRAEEAKVDFLEVSIRQPDEVEVSQREGYKVQYENASTTNA